MGFNDDLIADIRAHDGEVTEGFFKGKPVLLLTTFGARTGRRLTVPVIYTRDGDRYVVVASKGGAPAHPAWYHNLQANPEVEVEVGGESFRARAADAAPADRDRLYAQQVAVQPSFAEYPKRTSRIIPVVLLERI